MAANDPFVFIKGIDQVIKKDLQKHKDLLLREKTNLDAYREAVSHQIKKKRHYKSLIGGGKFDDDALQKSIEMIVIDIRHFTDKVKVTEEAIEHHKLIVDTLTEQLEDWNKSKRMRDEALHAAAN